MAIFEVLYLPALPITVLLFFVCLCISHYRVRSILDSFVIVQTKHEIKTQKINV